MAMAQIHAGACTRMCCSHESLLGSCIFGAGTSATQKQGFRVCWFQLAILKHVPGRLEDGDSLMQVGVHLGSDWLDAQTTPTVSVASRWEDETSTIIRLLAVKSRDLCVD